MKRIAFALIRVALNILHARLPELIKEEWLYRFSVTKVDGITKIVNIYTDDNPDDKAQMKEFSNSYLPEVFESDTAILKEFAISQVNDEEVNQILDYHSTVLKDVLIAVTDANKDNKAQLKVIKDKYKEGSLDVGLEWFLAKTEKIKDPVARAIIQEAVKEAIKLELTAL
ncbi:hypothetical protein [Chondrinema litorale]|uniref:hypothetical protein n=1 Tax=Chondrinema litorale TaxID=2994555 RepID=UPI0025426C42|nr:hypothetical protein [Chondrinema litorale]UZS00276.1 hypothetical protein OQ292_40760 [Chondrinema litorale]